MTSTVTVIITAENRNRKLRNSNTRFDVVTRQILVVYSEMGLFSKHNYYARLMFIGLFKVI